LVDADAQADLPRHVLTRASLQHLPEDDRADVWRVRAEDDFRYLNAKLRRRE
jgi:hypothetical protein